VLGSRSRSTATDAVVRAAMRSEKLLAYADLDGRRTWLAIIDRIHGLSTVTASETRH
jgi:hypothetical protein